MSAIEVSIGCISVVRIPHSLGKVVPEPKSVDRLAESIEIVLLRHGSNKFHELILKN
jgi:hypothetical protein